MYKREKAFKIRFQYNEHQANDASTNMYPSFYDNEGDVVYILPIYFCSIKQLIELIPEDLDLEDFLTTKLTSSQLIMSLSGKMFVGQDIFDYLK